MDSGLTAFRQDVCTMSARRWGCCCLPKVGRSQSSTKNQRCWSRSARQNRQSHTARKSHRTLFEKSRAPEDKSILRSISYVESVTPHEYLARPLMVVTTTTTDTDNHRRPLALFRT